MTSLKCHMCGTRWQEGPTRDHQEGTWCRKCIQTENNRFRDALRCSVDIGARRLLLPSEVTHWQALLAEPANH